MMTTREEFDSRVIELIGDMRAALENEPVMVTRAVLTGALLGLVLGHDEQEQAHDYLAAMTLEMHHQITVLWPMKEVVAAGGLN